MKRYFIALFAAAALAGCSSALTDSPNAALTPSPAATPTPTPSPTPCLPVTTSSENIYASNSDLNNRSIMEYAAGSRGNVSPIRSFFLPGSVNGWGANLAVDASGYVYVARFGSSATNLDVYSPTSCGTSSMPTATVFLSTNPAYPAQPLAGVAVDGNGNVYVPTGKAGSPGTTTVSVYPPIHASPAPSPAKTIAGALTGLNNPSGVAVDRQGDIFVANNASGGTDGSITEYDKSASGDQAPVATIAGAATGINNITWVGVDALGYIYAGSSSSASQMGIEVFAPGSNGNAAPLRSIPVYGTTQAAFDSSGNVYVGVLGTYGGIAIYSSQLNSQLGSIAGAMTGLPGANGVAIGP